MFISFFTGMYAEQSILSLPPINKAPIIDGKIDKDEWRNASTQFGAISTTTKLLSVRNVTFFLTYDNDNIYFAQRSDIPQEPMILTQEDTTEITLLPPGCSKPYIFKFNSLNNDNLSDGVKVAGSITQNTSKEHPRKYWECEALIPLSAVGVDKLEDGAEWGFQMTRNWQNPKDTACWHLPDEKNQYGTFIPERDIPTVSFDGLGSQYWTTSYDIKWQVVNTAGKKLTIKSSASILSIEAPRDINRTDVLEPGGSTSYGFREVLLPGVQRTLNATVSDPDSNRIYYQRSFSWDTSNGLNWQNPDPPIILDIGIFPTYKKAKARLWCENQKKLSDLSNIVFKIRDEKGKVFYESEAEKRSNSDYYKMWEQLELPLGEYFITAEITAKDGKKSVIERDFAIRSFPWQNNDIGKARIVIPPFKPLKINRDNNEIHALQTGYRINGAFWDAIYAQGENILESPIEFTINGGKFKALKTKLVSVECDEVVYESELEFQNLKLKVIHQYEFDGMCKVSLSFDPGAGVDIKELYLDIPLKKELAKLYHCVGSGMRSNTSGFLPEGTGLIWDSKDKKEKHLFKNWGSFRPYFWFGGIYKGISWFCETPRCWTQDDSRATMELIRDDKAATLRIHIISKPSFRKEPFDIVMGFQPTPVKPRPEEYRSFSGVLWRYCPSNTKTTKVGLSYSSLSGAGCRIEDGIAGYPPDGDYTWLDYIREGNWKTQKEVEEFAQKFLDKHNMNDKNYPPDRWGSTTLQRMWQAANFFKQATDPFPYLNGRVLCSKWPEAKMYQDEWWTWGYAHSRRDKEYEDHYNIDPVPSYQDFSLYYYREKLRSSKGWLAGIYIDNIYDAYVCNPLSGLAVEVNPNDFMPFCSIFNMREFLKRTAIMLLQEGKLIGGYPALYLHMTNCNIIPWLSMAAMGLDWEMNFGDSDYPVRFSEGRILAVTLGTQAGIMPEVIVQTSNTFEPTVRSAIAVFFYFDLLNHHAGGMSRSALYRDVIDKVRNFGYGDINNVKVFPGWAEDNPVKSNQPEVRCTVLERNDRKYMLLVGNIGDACTVELDISGLRYPSYRIYNAESGKERGAGPKLSLELSKYGYTILIVEAQK